MTSGTKNDDFLTTTIGERRWIWGENIFLNGVLPMGIEGGATDEEDLKRKIGLKVLELKGIPLVKQHVVLQPMNDHETDKQLDLDEIARLNNGEPPVLPPVEGVFVSMWIQWLPEVMRREKLRRRGKNPESRGDRNYLITCSVNVDVDAKLLKLKRWGTSSTDPPSDHDKYSMKAIAHR